MGNRLGMQDLDFANLSRGILAEGNSIRFEAHGSSMFPLIRDGDLLTIQPIEILDVKPRDVVFYQSTVGRCIAHRVLKIEIQNEQRIMITRGDASPRSEEPVQEEQVLGRVVEIHRSDKQINLSRNLWWVLSRHLPGFLLFMYLIVRVQRKIHR